jgi:hypothetical protein
VGYRPLPLNVVDRPAKKAHPRGRPATTSTPPAPAVRQNSAVVDVGVLELAPAVPPVDVDQGADSLAVAFRVGSADVVLGDPIEIGQVGVVGQFGDVACTLTWLCQSARASTVSDTRGFSRR